MGLNVVQSWSSRALCWALGNGGERWSGCADVVEVGGGGFGRRGGRRGSGTVLCGGCGGPEGRGEQGARDIAQHSFLAELFFLNWCEYEDLNWARPAW